METFWTVALAVTINSGVLIFVMALREPKELNDPLAYTAFRSVKALANELGYDLLQWHGLDRTDVNPTDYGRDNIPVKHRDIASNFNPLEKKLEDTREALALLLKHQNLHVVTLSGKELRKIK